MTLRKVVRVPVHTGPAGWNAILPPAAPGETYDRTLTNLNRQAIDFAKTVVRTFGLPLGFFQRSGKIHAAASEVGDQANCGHAVHLQALGAANQMLDAQAMRLITGSSYYAGGLFTPGTATIQPAGQIRGLAAGLEGPGVTVLENAPVIGFESKGGHPSRWRCRSRRCWRAKA